MFKVLTKCDGHYEDCWTDEVDGVVTPVRFETFEAAEAEIKYHIKCAKEHGMDYDRASFMIVPVE